MATSLIESYKAILDDVRQKMAVTMEDLARQKAVESFAMAEIAKAVAAGQQQPPENHPPVPVNGTPAIRDEKRLRFELKNATKQIAAEVALREIGHPAKVGDMVDFLVSCGFGVDLERRILFNSIYTAMSRQSAVFEKRGRGEWSLVEWKRGADQTEPDQAEKAEHDAME